MGCLGKYNHGVESDIYEKLPFHSFGVCNDIMLCKLQSIQK